MRYNWTLSDYHCFMSPAQEPDCSHEPFRKIHHKNSGRKLVNASLMQLNRYLKSTYLCNPFIAVLPGLASPFNHFCATKREVFKVLGMQKVIKICQHLSEQRWFQNQPNLYSVLFLLLTGANTTASLLLCSCSQLLSGVHIMCAVKSFCLPPPIQSCILREYCLPPLQIMLNSLQSC